jgi:hypothetical protein
MPRAIARSRLRMQVVLQGDASRLRQRMESGNISFEVLEQPGPLTLRVAAADWKVIRALADEGGYTRPDFFCQSDAGEMTPLKRQSLQPKIPVIPALAAIRLKKR